MPQDPNKWDKYIVNKWEKYVVEEPTKDILDVFKSSFAESPEQKRGLRISGQTPRAFDPTGRIPMPIMQGLVNVGFGIAEQAGTVPPVLLGGLGAAAGFAGGGPPGAIGGAALGTAAGENLRNLMGRIMLGSPKNQSLLGDIQKTAEAAAIGGLGEGGGQVLARGAQKFAAPFAKQVDPEMLEFTKKTGIRGTPSELLDESSVGAEALRAGERVAESTITGGPVFRKLKASRFDQLMGVARQEADKIATLQDESTIKRLTVEAIGGKSQTFTREASKIYKEIDKQTRGLGVDITSVKAFAQKALSSIPEKARIAAGKGGTEASSLVNQLEAIAGLPNKVPFEDAHFWRSQLLTTVRQDVTPLGGRIRGTASKMAGLFENRMEKAALASERDLQRIGNIIQFQGRKFDKSGNLLYEEYKIIDPGSPANNANISVRPNENLVDRVLTKEREFGKKGLVQQIRDANQFYREGKELYNDAFIASMAERRPEVLADDVFKSIENIRKIKRAADENAFKNIQRAKVENILQSSMGKEKTGETFFQGGQALKQWNKLSDEIKREGFSPETRSGLERFFRAAANLPTKEQSLGLWGMSQAVGALSAVGFGDVSTAGVIVLTPHLFARLVTSPGGVKWLTEGLRISPGTQEAIRFAARFNVYFASKTNFKVATKDVLQ